MRPHHQIPWCIKPANPKSQISGKSLIADMITVGKKQKQEGLDTIDYGNEADWLEEEEVRV